MADFKGIVYLSQEQYDELYTNGSVVVDGETILFDENTQYLTPYEETGSSPGDVQEQINEINADIQDLQDQIDEISTDNLVDLESNQEIGGVKTFKDNIGVKNTDGTIDYIKHINNNFLISTSAGTNLMNIDEGLSKAYFFNKEIAFKEDVTGAGGTKVYVGGVLQDTFNADTKANKTLVETLMDELDDISAEYGSLSTTVENVSVKTNSNETMLNSLAVEVANAQQDIADNMNDISALEVLVTSNIDEISNIKQTVDDKADKSELPIGLPIGSIISSAIPITDASVQLLDGHTISQSGAYADFVALLKEKVSSGSVKTCTSQEFDNEVALYGNCGKFVIDDSAGTVRLPRITRFIQGLSSLSDIGTSVEAGLPNIEGSWRRGSSAEVTTVDDGEISGVFYQSGERLQGRTFGNSSSNYAGNNSLGFDASRSNSIYGNSNTVQPQATQFPYYIVLSNTVKTNIIVDIDNIASDLSATNNEISSVKAIVNSRDYIVEQGSNYVRWNNGLQICWGSIYSSSTTVNTHVFQAPFIDTNYGITKNNVTTSNSGTYTPRLLGIYAQETTQFQTYGQINISWVAIGRWK